jgi:hypothetical protein
MLKERSRCHGDIYRRIFPGMYFWLCAHGAADYAEPPSQTEEAQASGGNYAFACTFTRKFRPAPEDKPKACAALLPMGLERVGGHAGQPGFEFVIGFTTLASP